MDEPTTGQGQADRPHPGGSDDPTAPIPPPPDPVVEAQGTPADDLTQPIPPIVAPPPEAARVVTAAPAGSATTVTTRPVVSRRRRIGAWVGIVVSAILIVVVVLGRFYAVGKIDDLAGRVDNGLQRGVTLIDAASGRIQPVVDAADTVADAAEAAAASPTGPIANVAALLGEVTGLGERYRQFRTSYDDARVVILGAFERLHTIDALIPQLTIPSGPEDAFRGLDERILGLDQAFTDLAAATPLGDVSNEAAGNLAEKARGVETVIGGIVGALDDAQTRLQQARVDVQSLAGTINLAVTLILLVFILGFLYIVLLNWLLLHPGVPRTV
jgi:hypothetical protein